MPSSPSVLDIPQRALLSVQAAAALRRGLDQGIWARHLPSERRLSEMYHVSRPTIRKALAILAEEGLIALQGRRRTRTVPARRARSAGRGRKIVIVTHQFSAQWTTTTYQGLSEMQAYLGKHGFECEVLVCPERRIASQLQELADYIRENGVICTLLVTVRRALQQWFARQRLPTLVLGSCHATVALPSFDVDYFSVSRHAVGVLASKGHRRIALLLPKTESPGDLATEAGFLAAAPAAARSATPTGIVVRHSGSARNVQVHLDALFRSARPPTALLVSRPSHCLVVLTHLLRRGLAVPEKVSLIARDQDPLFDQLAPVISHYAFGIDSSTRRLVRLILKLVEQKQLPTTPNLILPQFVPGATVRPPPAT